MILDSDVILVGRVNKTHGTDGEVSASFFDADVMDIIDVDTCVFFKIDGIYVPFFVDGVRPRGGESLLISFDGEDSQQAVAQFVGHDIYMDRADVPEEQLDSDGLYAAQLIGFEAVLDDGAVLGVIQDIDDSTDNPLFIVSRSGSADLLIPIVDDFISDINFDDRKLTFDLPDGLISINE